MSDHEGVPEADLGLDDDAAGEQGGWSPVMGTPPPEADPGIGTIDAPAPHEAVATELMPPPPPPEPDLDVAPPPPPIDDGGLPPAMPDAGPPVDLSGEPVAFGEPPMPPVAGDAAAPPPPPGTTDGIDLGDGPPLAPAIDGGPGDGDQQAPWPEQGTPPAGDAGEVVLGDPPMPPVQGDLGTAPPQPGTVDGPDVGAPTAAPGADPAGGPQSPVPPMGGPGPVAPAAPGDGDVELGDPPMPPVTGDRDTAPPAATDDQGDDVAPQAPPTPGDATDGQTPVPPMGEEPVVPTDPSPVEEPTGPDDIAVAPGSERLAAAALTGWYLEVMDVDDPLRDWMVDRVEQYAQDGEVTMEELHLAFAEAQMLTTADGSPDTLDDIIQRNEQTVILTTTDEGTGLYRARMGDGRVELESLRSRAVYEADPQDVARAWRDSGAAVIAPPEVLPEAAPAAVVADAPESSDGGGARDAFIAGAVLLPIAGGAAYFATRKIR